MKSVVKQLGQVCAVVGGQWGDEGKGKLVDILAREYDIVARATGGANAGHTIYVGDKKFVFHLVPAGMLHPKKICVMGNGMVVHFPTLLLEIEVLEKAGMKTKGRLKLSDRAHIVFDYHRIIDGLQEASKGASKVGTTGRGIGPAYADKISRIGVRAGELSDFDQFCSHYRRNLEFLKRAHGFSHDGEAELKKIKKMLPRLKNLIANTGVFLADAFQKKKTVLVEGANGTLLDIDHGTYPYVTSSNASIGGVVTGAGIAPRRISSAIGIMKAYCTRVGAGPFPTELDNKLGAEIREIGGEFGATTGRPRRCGWFDAVASGYSAMLNGFTAINLTKIDVLNSLKELKIGVAYKYKGKRLADFPADLSVLGKCEVKYIKMPGWGCDVSAAKTFDELPKNCRAYIKTIEKLVGCPVMFIGTGKRREEMILKIHR